jgi:hypothetical protein
MSIRRIAFCVLAALFVAAPAAASNPWTYSELNKTVPGANGNSPEDDARPGEYYFMRGVDAVHAGDYTHAIDMYQVAASWGYKDAQYNLGVIYAKGEQGVPADLPRAMAWMALAAERNDKRYVEARELVYSLLNKEQWDQANVIWRDLKLTYADAVALPRAKARWAEARNGATGSHVGSPGGRLEVGSWTDGPGLVKISTFVDSPLGTQVPTVGRSAADVAGPNTVDGTVAYGALRATDNPYDPRFFPVGTATVQPPQTVGEAKSNDPGKG